MKGKMKMVSEKIGELYILLADTVSCLNLRGNFHDLDQELITSDKKRQNNELKVKKPP